MEKSGEAKPREAQEDFSDKGLPIAAVRSHGYSPFAAIPIDPNLFDNFDITIRI